MTRDQIVAALIGPEQLGGANHRWRGEHDHGGDLPINRWEAGERVHRPGRHPGCDDAPVGRMTPRWVVRATFAVSLCALAVSAYLTIAHYTSPGVLACSGSGTIDCAKVTTSAQSRFLGIPVSVLGLGWSIVMVALCSPRAWRSTSRWIRRARVIAASGAMLFVLWLVYAELVLVRAICVWCTTMHVLAFGLFVLIVVFGVVDQPAQHELVSETE